MRSALWPLTSRLAVLHRRVLVSRTRVVAVTGSFGKTTTTRAVSAAIGYEQRRKRGGNAFAAIARAVLRTRPWDRYLVIEVGVAGPGQMDPYTSILRPDIAVVTSIGSEHMRSFGSLEATRAEKAKLVRALPPTGLAVLNGDDPMVRSMATETRARVATFGFESQNDVRATDLELVWPEGSRFTIGAGGKRRSVTTRLLGWPMVYPLLAAVTVALFEGQDLDETLARLEALPQTPGRLEVIPLENGAFVLRDDFKSTLETVDAALDVLAEIPARRRMVVLGEVSEPPGSQGPIYRRLGARVAEVASRAVFVGVNFQRYAAGARGAGLPATAMVNAGRDVLGAAELVRSWLGPGDVVLVKGRDTQRLDRIWLAIEGRPVRCNIDFCDARGRCDSCPMLERGWDGTPVAT
jgi:UDP-N-acetylmuramyl pentapeptide synthase